MNKLYRIKRNLPLLLIIGILILCAGFIIISCGKKPQKKVADAQRRQCALDFNRAVTNRATALLQNGNWPSIANTEVTVETWINQKVTSANAGGIFSRYDGKGVMMWVKDQIPKFAIRVLTAATSTPGGPTPTVDYTVEGTTSLLLNTWHHIVGMLANKAHTHPTSTSCTSIVMAEMPHLDIYVNGQFENCATTWGDPTDPATGPQFAEDPFKALGGPATNTAVLGVLPLTPLIPGVDGLKLGDNSQFRGVIDEVRLWTVARTPVQIQTCSKKELNLIGRDECTVDPDILKGYWRMNECEGHETTDWSGAGTKGIIEIGAKEWDDGWVDGVPIEMDDTGTVD